MQRDWSARIAVVVGYVCVAIAFSWPLPLHFGSALTGDPGGDTGVYVWNLWVFHHEMAVDHTNPLRTDNILAMTDPVELSQHNYTIFQNVLALPLIDRLGVVPTFNMVLVLLSVVTGLCTYALARRATGAGRAEAWLAGVAFAWAPAMVARSTGHFSLVAAAPLAAFVLFLLRADRSRRPRDAALAGLSMAWAAVSDPYYAIYGLLIAGGYVARRLVRVTFTPAPVPVSIRLPMDLLLAATAGAIAALTLGWGGQFEVLGVPVSVRGLYTPVMVFTALVLVRITLHLRPRVAAEWRFSASMARLLVIGGVAGAAALSPVLYGLGVQLFEGEFVRPPTLWRSSPRGVDLLGLFEPNPNHPLVRQLRNQQLADPTAFVEFTAALSLVAIGVVAYAVWRGGYRPRAGWVWLTVGFAALSLGPFVHVAGINTHIPGPWAVVRYIPVIDAARMPTRFSLVAALGLAILFAGALTALGRRDPRHRRALVVTIAALLLFELSPAPRELYAATVPAVFDIVARDPRPVRVLHLPFGVRDGTFTAGDFSARYLFYQTAHGKPLTGGYLSRISQKRVRKLRAQATLDALMLMSEGSHLSEAHAAQVRAERRRFLARSKVGYVVVDLARTPPHLMDFVVDAWALEEIGRDGGLVLYRPARR